MNPSLKGKAFIFLNDLHNIHSPFIHFCIFTTQNFKVTRSFYSVVFRIDQEHRLGITEKFYVPFPL